MLAKNARHGPQTRADRVVWSGARVVVAGNFEALHFRLQSGALQPQATCGAIGSGEHAMGFAKDAQNVLAFGGIQTMIRAGRKRGEGAWSWFGMRGTRAVREAAARFCH